MDVKLFHPQLYLLQFPLGDNFKIHVYLDDTTTDKLLMQYYDCNKVDDDNETLQSIYERFINFEPQSTYHVFMRVYESYKPALQQNNSVDRIIAGIRLEMFTDTKLKHTCRLYGIYYTDMEFNRSRLINVLKLWYKY